MAVPELISWAKVSGFRFPTRGKSPQYPDIHLEHFLKAVGGREAITSIEILNGRRVVCVDPDGQKLHEWTAHRCLYAEIDHGDESFVLSSGKWYKVKSDFVAETNAAYDRIPKYEATFPEFMDDSEGQYLRRVVASAPKRFVLMDQKMVSYGGGRSQIEFCDLFSTADLVHVKRYGQSSALSHLFAQGLVSGELFQMDANFRGEINRQLPRGRKLQNPAIRPQQNQFRVVFAIISDRRGDLRLPFFSRLNLKHAERRLEAYGFRVARAKIDVNEAFSKTAKFRLRRGT